MGHCLDIQEDPQCLEQILSDCKETLKYCVKTGEKTCKNPSFLFCWLNPPARSSQVKVKSFFGLGSPYGRWLFTVSMA